MHRAKVSPSCVELGAVISVLLLHPVAAMSLERLDPIVVTATRNEERAFELPLSIDSLDAAQIQQNQLQINLSESLARVPGLSVQNRSNRFGCRVGGWLCSKSIVQGAQRKGTHFSATTNHGHCHVNARAQSCS